MIYSLMCKKYSKRWYWCKTVQGINWRDDFATGLSNNTGYIYLRELYLYYFYGDGLQKYAQKI